MPSQLPPLPCEQALIENLPTTLRSERALVISPGRGQTAVHVAATVPECRPTVWYADLHRARLAQEAIGEHDLPIDVACNADLPDALFDLAAVAVLARDEAEWTRDILQQAHQRLDMHGQLIASVDNPRDRWLGEQMRSMFDKVT